MTEASTDLPVILVVENVEEIRDGIEKLLNADGYRVDPAKDEEDAVQRANRKHPDLILMTSGEHQLEIIETACRIRERAGLADRVAVVIFCMETVTEGDAVDIGRNIHLTRPDNFDQLRYFLCRLLQLSHIA